MKRTRKPEKADLILTSDWHLRESTPKCRTDDFWKAQTEKIDRIAELQQEHGCPVIHAGDLFEHWKASPNLLTTSMLLLPKQFMTIYGQHDLPYHNLDLAHKCGVYTLATAGAVDLLSECHWNQEPKKGSLLIPQMTGDRKILVKHALTWADSRPHWSDALTAKEVLKEYPDYDLIVTGDNHQSFAVEYKGRLLVNPGALTRQKADEADNGPRVYLWYRESNTVKAVYLPIQQDVISREHIEKQGQRDERIAAFVERLKTEWQSGLSFEKNLETFFAKNRVRTQVQEIVWKAVERERQ